MRVPMSWLAELVDHGLAAEALADKLTAAGIKVEAIHHLGTPDVPANRESLLIGKVMEAGRHPDADKLSVCMVEVGDGEPRQIVCGAPNVRAGLTVAVSLPGALLPGADKPLKKAKLRGVESNGMILSGRELELSDDHSGIMELDETLAAGTPLADVLPLSETVLEFELPANRPDLLGIWGIAREVATVTGAQLIDPDTTMPTAQGDRPAEDLLGLEVVARDLTPRYMATVLTGVTMGPSPDWMQRRLDAAGMRPINNVVDITNYVMLLTGQPLHAFDLNKLAGPELVVRRATQGEIITTLDGVERTMTTDMLAICDAEKPAVVAGVFGAQFAEVDDSTRDIALEAATFVGPNVLATSWGLGLRTESSRRLEKGLSHDLPPVATAVACRLLVELCGASLAPGGHDVHDRFNEAEPITVRHARTEAILAMDVDTNRSADILRSLGCDVEEGADRHVVQVPYWRTRDLEREIDLIEEIGRHLGYDEIKGEIPRLVAHAKRTPMQTVRERLSRLAVDLGFSEAITLHFVPQSDADKLQLPADDPRRDVVRIANPLSEDVAVMRRSLLPGLLRAAARNQARQLPAGRLFEVGRTYAPLADGGADEREWIVGLMFGQPGRDHWRGEAGVVDFYAAKGVAEALARAGHVNVAATPSDNPYGHPGRQATLTVGEAKVGWVGELHPLVLRDFDVKGPAVAWGLDLQALVDNAPAERPLFENLLSVPGSTRDLALVVDATVPAADILALARKSGGNLVRDVQLFDRYQGGQVPAGKVSLALRFTIAAADRTLTDDEIAKPVGKVADRLAKEFGAELRG